jgi:predicted RNA-binding Zn ribbon-like protein
MKRTESPANSQTAESLALIEAVVNTRYGRTFPDAWKSVEQMRTWLIEHKLLAEDAPLTQGDHRRMLEVREALRALLYHNNGMPIASEYIETLNFLAKHSPLLVRFDQAGRAELTPDLSGVEGAIATLLGTVYTAMANGTWTRLKACRNERCQKAFYDSSKNHSGTWCAMARCGSRVKARAYRQRRQLQIEVAEELNDSV